MLRSAADLIRERFPKVRKNSSGYALDAWLSSGDLLDLFIGSEGTLGVVREIGWELEPVPLLRGGVLVGIRNLPELSAIIPDLLDLAPAALEFLDASLLRFVESRSGIDRYRGLDGLLMMEFEAEDQEALRARIGAATALLSSRSEDLHAAMDPRSLDRLWGIRHAASPLLASMGESRRSLQVIEDACVPPIRIAEYVHAVRAAGSRHGIDLVIFGHFGDGNVHVNLQPDIATPDWEARIEAIFEEVSETVIGLGGSLTGEHGDGRLRAPMLEGVYGPEVVDLFRAVKGALDPAGILNPGVKLPAGDARPLERLKVGGSREPIPGEIERALREIERTASYSVSRLELSAMGGGQ
jgi:FAD/FMN-containing dehydrogenase